MLSEKKIGSFSACAAYSRFFDFRMHFPGLGKDCLGFRARPCGTSQAHNVGDDLDVIDMC
tara:strand:+ start:263 stop:442 length:180 start_codon:yes stop_codon:yes gene_type:complete